MNKTIFSLLMLFAAIRLSANVYVEPAYNAGINITPRPNSMVLEEGNFVISEKTAFVISDASLEPVAEYFADKFRLSAGLEMKIIAGKQNNDCISLKIDNSLDVNDEGYVLKADRNSVKIAARTPRGVFYGMQTLMQLLPAEIESPFLVEGVEWRIPAVTVKDEPAFGYRGLHLDVCRHFADVEFIKKQLDVLAMFKINVFHWHLTDDQGWRVEIKKYPELTRAGATRIDGELTQYGPFYYTQEQIKEVVAYAKERFIEVIPEIELPGHAVAAVAAYPYLSCTGRSIPVRNLWGVSDDVFCAGNEEVFAFLEDVFEEIIPLFESEYIHIGGDECLKNKWEQCEKCQARIRELGLADDEASTAEQKLQSYFVERIEAFLLKHGKKIIGWDEILEGGISESATVMSWRGEAGGISAANKGHDIIMTPVESLYLDKFQGSPKIQPVTIGGYLPLERVYEYDPVPESIAPERRHHVLGAQGNMWNEYNYCESDMEYDIYPRIIALAELTWTEKDGKDYDDFLRRLDNQRVRLDMHDINYYIPLPEQKDGPSCNNVVFTDSVVLKFTTTEPVARIVWSDEGRAPGLYSKEYRDSLVFTEDAVLKIRSVLPSGVMGPVRTIDIRKEALSPAVPESDVTVNGIKAEYYNGYCLTYLDLAGRTPDETEIVDIPFNSGYQLPENGLEPDMFKSTVLTGYIRIPEDGVYYFSTDSELWIDGRYLISNERDNYGKARKFSRFDNGMALAKGLHPFRMVRLGATFGGTPTQCLNMYLNMRKSDSPDFRTLKAEDFK